MTAAIRCSLLTMTTMGIPHALNDLNMAKSWSVPMVVRIVGTNATEAAELLQAARFVTAASLDEAAAKAVAAAKGGAA